MTRKTKPEAPPAWQDAFRAASVRVGFAVHLTRAMCEFLSAVADGVQWDRSKYGACAAFPDNFLATARALVKRGVVEIKTDDEREAMKHRPDEQLWQWNSYRLTPAGEHVVGLLRLAGLFIQADAAIERDA